MGDFQLVEERVGGVQQRRPGPRVRQLSGGVSRTKQEFAREVDVNRIVGRFRDLGTVVEARKLAEFLDLSGGPSSLLEAIQLVRRSDELFMDLPAHVRAAVNNRPEQLVELVSDPERFDEAVELGVVVKPDGWVPRAEREKAELLGRLAQLGVHPQEQAKA